MSIFEIVTKYHNQVVTIDAPAEKVFEYITTPANFPLWLKDVWIAGKTFGKMGLGCSMIQTIRLINPRKFNMKVTGYLENRYFRIQALKGFLLMPGYVCLSLVKAARHSLLYMVELKTSWKTTGEMTQKDFTFFIPQVFHSNGKYTFSCWKKLY